MKQYLLVFIFIVLHWSCTTTELPEFYVKSVANPIINLNGTWHINTNPEKDFWKHTTENSNWKEVKVPGEVMMQGFSIKNDIPFAYKKEIDIPLDYANQNIYLQFNGVYSYARVWVNGNLIREHHGGFTQWKCDITPYVEAGKTALIAVEVTDRADDISYASGYAKHQIAGILRSVSLLALPENYPETVQIETDLDAQYKDATLIISGKLKSKNKNANLKIQLFDADKKEVALKKTVLQFQGEDNFKFSNLIMNPRKWDAEHPNLYTLKISFYENDELYWNKEFHVGFREIKIEGNQFLVNGNSVKLRGACRHDIHPTLGRVATPEYDLKDVLLAKEANMNFIRTSHYPPTENFLKLCDEYGIYVEDETAVCFIIDYRIKGYKTAVQSYSDSAYTGRYLSQLKEMVNAHRNHPSIIMWSIGNESVYGTNFQKSFDWIQANDSTRPVLFSYPGTVADSIAKPYDLLSMHYPDFNNDRIQYGKQTENFGYATMPVLFDEWAHVACYNNSTITEDPNVRDFWGQSLNTMWTKTVDADGGLGGAIWGMIDETFMLPKNLKGFGDWWGIEDSSVKPYKGTTVGYGEWGIVDVWRRKKPEFWNTKKAYSPIKLLETTIQNYKLDKPIAIPIYNRFDHTNLNEIRIKYTYKGKTHTLDTFNLKPHTKGILKLPITNWNRTEKIKIDFFDTNARLIDSYRIKQKNELKSKLDEATISEKISIDSNDSILTVHTSKGNLVFNKHTGLLDMIGKYTISGPFLNYRTEGEKINYSTYTIKDYGKNWKLKRFKSKTNTNTVTIYIDGMYGEISAHFELEITVNGTIKTSYSYKNLPKKYVREIGVKYNFDLTFDELHWKRIGYWSVYPKNHLSSLTGKVKLYSNEANEYRKKPKKIWIEDTKSFYYDGTDTELPKALTQIAKATKENCIEYTLLKNEKKWLTVFGEGKVSCRLAKKDTILELYLNHAVDYTNLNWGNYERLLLLEGSYTGTVRMLFNIPSTK